MVFILYEATNPLVCFNRYLLSVDLKQHSHFLDQVIFIYIFRIGNKMGAKDLFNELGSPSYSDSKLTKLKIRPPFILQALFMANGFFLDVAKNGTILQ